MRFIACDVRKGTRLDALKFSLGANQSNGLRRTNADKRHCVELALAEFPKLSDRAIAGMCGVYHQLVADVRPPKVDDSSTCKTHTGLDGKEYPASKPKAHASSIASSMEPEPEERPHVVAGPVAPAGNIPKILAEIMAT